MRWIFVLLILVNTGTSRISGELTVQFSSGEMRLTFYFHSWYNDYTKYCCTLYQSRCSIFVNSNGGFTPQYKNKIRDFSNGDGTFTVVITDLSVSDAGTYRCGFYELFHIYTDKKVTLADLGVIRRTNLLPKSTVKPKISTTSSNISPPSEEEEPGFATHMKATLPAVVSVLVSVVIILILLGLYLKKKQIKSVPVDRPISSLVPEQNSTIYTAVEFKPHQEAELYANVQMLCPDPGSFTTCVFKTEEHVEYSTVLSPSQFA